MWQVWVISWIISMIIETGIWTLDFLDLWIAAILTGIFIYINPNIWADPMQQAIIFWLISWILLILTRVFVTPKLKNSVLQDRLMSQDNMIGQQLNVNIYNWKNVVYYDWIYWVVESKDIIQKWDIVKIIARDGSKLLVEKLS